jgi:hypothetical protein
MATFVFAARWGPRAFHQACMLICMSDLAAVRYAVFSRQGAMPQRESICCSRWWLRGEASETHAAQAAQAAQPLSLSVLVGVGEIPWFGRVPQRWESFPPSHLAEVRIRLAWECLVLPRAGWVDLAAVLVNEPRLSSSSLSSSSPLHFVLLYLRYQLVFFNCFYSCMTLLARVTDFQRMRLGTADSTVETAASEATTRN